MVESPLSRLFESEQALAAAAGGIAVAWRARGLGPLLVGLTGGLGSGKSTWVRAMLRGLGHAGRVPSPTYTLIEHYPLEGLTVVHLDLYRLADPLELENLGVRDWLAAEGAWLFVEWPERGGLLAERVDLVFAFEVAGPASRRVAVTARSAAGRAALAAFRGHDFNNSI